MCIHCSKGYADGGKLVESITHVVNMLRIKAKCAFGIPFQPVKSSFSTLKFLLHVIASLEGSSKRNLRRSRSLGMLVPKELIVSYFLYHLLSKENVQHVLPDYHLPFLSIFESFSNNFDLSSVKKDIARGSQERLQGWQRDEDSFCMTCLSLFIEVLGFRA